MRSHRNAGFTLAEVMILTVVVAEVLYLLWGFFRMVQQADSRNTEVLAADVYELERRIEFDLSSKFEGLVAASQDPELQKCFSDACAPGCEKHTSYRGIEWGPVPLQWVIYKDSFGNTAKVNEGGRYKLPAWSLCRPLSVTTQWQRGDDLFGPVQYEKSCVGAATAHWKVGQRATLDFRIVLSLDSPSTRFDRNLDFVIPRKKWECLYE